MSTCEKSYTFIWWNSCWQRRSLVCFPMPQDESHSLQLDQLVQIGHAWVLQFSWSLTLPVHPNVIWLFFIHSLDLTRTPDGPHDAEHGVQSDQFAQFGHKSTSQGFVSVSVVPLQGCALEETRFSRDRRSGSESSNRSSIAIQRCRRYM